MARSTYYFEINKTDPVAIRNEELLLVIKKIFVENKGRYGVRRVYMELKNRGYNVNHKRVQRLMHDAGLFGKRPKEKYHSYKGEVGKVADNVINRDFSTTLPLQKWTTDVSQFNFFISSIKGCSNLKSKVSLSITMYKKSSSAFLIFFMPFILL